MPDMIGMMIMINMTKPTTYIQVLNETRVPGGEGWHLCYQRIVIHGPEGSRSGFRFIWRNELDNMMSYRGQARIYSSAMALKLIGQAIAEGWGNIPGTDAELVEAA